MFLKLFRRIGLRCPQSRFWGADVVHPIRVFQYGFREALLKAVEMEGGGVRLGEISEFIMGQSPEGSSVGKSKGIEFHQGKISFTDRYISDSGFRYSLPRKIAPTDSVLLFVRALVGGCKPHKS
jgi:hypothetical protein